LLELFRAAEPVTEAAATADRGESRLERAAPAAELRPGRRRALAEAIAEVYQSRAARGWRIATALGEKW
jgi:hypothetical protein